MTRCPTCGGKVDNVFEHVDLDTCAGMSDAPRDGTTILGLYCGDERVPVRFEEDRGHPAGGPSLGAGWVVGTSQGDIEGLPADEPDAWTRWEPEHD